MRKSRNMTQVSLFLPTPWVKQMRKVATSKHLTLSDVVRAMLAKAVATKQVQSDGE